MVAGRNIIVMAVLTMDRKELAKHVGWISKCAGKEYKDLFSVTSLGEWHRREWSAHCIRADTVCVGVDQKRAW